jgi:hypothetical protein
MPEPAAAPAPLFVQAPAVQAARPEPQPAVRAKASFGGAGNTSLGISSTVPDEEQMLLRALLGVSDRMDADDVVRHTARIPGLSACVHIRGMKSIVYGDDSKPSKDFRQQAHDIANSLRTLATLSGIPAETLSFGLADRLVTFCFQGDNAFGVLHMSQEPLIGLTEKVTLISREINQMRS